MDQGGSNGKWVRAFAALLFGATGFVYLVSGLLAPYWAVGALWVVWVGFLVLFIRLWRGKAWVLFAIPFAVMAVWAAVMSFGDAVLDWTA